MRDFDEYDFDKYAVCQELDKAVEACQIEGSTGVR
jgi:hypothetical protein